jgi:threonine/homoserine/homoserine lactone efflux protein
MNYPAYLTYIFLAAFTPGPNNVLSMSNASKYGFKKSFPFNLGVLFGFLIVMAASAAFTSSLYEFIPQIETFMSCLGAAYILWLAWTIWRDTPHDDKKRTLRTNSILTGVTLQFINVKVILYGITGMSTFILPYHKGFWALSLFVLLMSFVGFAGTCCWALFGSVFEVIFDRHRKTVNGLLALLLVYCARSQLAAVL